MNINNKDIIDVFNFRYACKKFNPSKVVSEADFQTILQSAQLSPSSFGFEPWKFLIVQNEDLKKKLYPIAWGAQNALNGASHFVIILARKKIDTIYSADYITHIMQDIQKLPPDVQEGMRGAFKSFEENDFKLLESDRAIFDWASKQTYIAMANMLTTAAFLGIDSCPIEGFNREAIDELLAKENLIDPQHFGVSVMAGFGYRDEEPHRGKTRQSLDDIIQWVK